MIVLLFDELCQVPGIDECLVYKNADFAIDSLEMKGLTDIKIDPDRRFFYFRYQGKTGSGRSIKCKML